MADPTRGEILSMPAGPEMDALVAERVMGHKIVWRFRPSTDMTTAMEVEHEIGKRGLIERYCEQLVLVVGSSFWRLIHATPDQRCRAALLTTLEE